MRDTIISKAKELANLLGESSEYQNILKAREEIKQREAAQVMLKDLEGKQEELRKSILAGKDPDQAQNELQQAYAMASYNPYVREYLEAEFSFAQLMMEIQEILGKALAPEEKEEEQGPIQQPKSNLWIPGQS